eukprot:gene5386-6705_t
MNIARRPALAALLAAPAFINQGRAQGAPIRLGVPTAMTGTWAALGAQVVRSCRLWAKTINAEGGLLGRPVEFLVDAGNAFGQRVATRCHIEAEGV